MVTKVTKEKQRESGKTKTADAHTRKRALALWTLLAEGGEGYGGKLKPEIEKAEREALREGGLVAVEKRKKGAFWLTVTDKGWDWAEQHLADPLPEKTQGGAFVLRSWLARLKIFLRARDIRLYQFFADQPEPSLPAHNCSGMLGHAELRERIRTAYQEVAGGFDRRLLLRDLRPRLIDLDRQLVDAALMQMLRDGEVSLMQLDYRPDVTDEDRLAALQVGNEPRHIIWISK